tara:strand:+ start:2373 stop:3416 length:1044 start_codon:yes stop_codon:yes gene_type:complete
MNETQIKIKSVNRYQDLNTFFDYESEGWIGSDVAHSIVIGNNKILWLFGDTFIGETENKKRSTDCQMLNNSIGIMTIKNDNPNEMKFFWNKIGGKNFSFFKQPDEMVGDFLWPTNGIVINDILYVFCMAVNTTQDHTIDIAGTISIKIHNCSETPEEWEMEYWDFQYEHGVVHSALFRKENYLYFLGFRGKVFKDSMFLGKLNIHDISNLKTSKSIKYFHKYDKWDISQKMAKPMFSPCNSESNIYYKKDINTYFTTTYFPKKNKLYLLWSKELYGPWSDPLHIYTIPERNRSFSVHSYAMRIHSWFSDQCGHLIISYATNEFGGLSNLFTSEGYDIYRPKFIRVEL